MGYKTPPHTALDALGSILNKEKEGQAKSFFSKEDEADSDDDMADVVFRKAILPGHTGDFDKVSKEDLPQSMSLPQGNGNSISKGKGPDINANECLVATESDSISSSPERLSDLNIHGNIQPSGRMSTSAQNEVPAHSAPFIDNTLPVTDPGNIT